MKYLVLSLLTAVYLLGVGANPADFMRYGYVSDEIRTLLVNEHNAWRNVAQASDMKKLTWSCELEDSAREFVKRCRFAHERAIFGENLGVSVGGYDTLFTKMIKEWYMEKAFYDYEKSECDEGEQCAHYTQLVWANTRYVGCSWARCRNIGASNIGDAWLVACRYWPRAGGKRPYRKGRPCSACGEYEECDDGLCAPKMPDFSPRARTGFYNPRTVPGGICNPPPSNRMSLLQRMRLLPERYGFDDSDRTATENDWINSENEENSWKSGKSLFPEY